MESRKIIAFGKSSRIISLPSSWLEKNNILKGDAVYLEEKGDELIVRSQSNDSKKEPSEIKIDIDGKSKEAIKREIISCYINDINIMYIVGKSVKDKAKEVREIIHSLVALEIMEETSDRIMAKDFLNMNDISISNLIRKIDVILRSMIIDSKAMFDEGAEADESLDSRDDDINRLVFLVFRVVKCTLNNGTMMKRMQLSPTDLLNSWIISFNLEKIADQVKRMTRIVSQLKLKKKEREEFIGFYSRIEKTYLDTMKSYYNKDKPLAYALAEERRKFMNEIDKGFDKYSDSASIGLREKLLNMVSSVHTITRISYE